MNREEFCSLPLPLALGLIWDSFRDGPAEDYLRDIEPPRPALPPKFDTAIYRKGGITWASEYDLDGLSFWKKRAEASAAEGGQWADKDARRARALAYWMEWRSQNPTAAWTGERNRQRVTAAPPQHKPEVYPRELRKEQVAAKQYDFADDADGDENDPF